MLFGVSGLLFYIVYVQHTPHTPAPTCTASLLDAGPCGPVGGGGGIVDLKIESGGREGGASSWGNELTGTLKCSHYDPPRHTMADHVTLWPTMSH